MSINSALLVTVIFFFSLGAYAQKTIDPQDTIPISLSEKRFNAKYQKNIKKSRINGVYIPIDLQDAFKELTELSSPESISKFKNADASFVTKRLHFSLGRWIVINWNLYDGSRINHHLKSYGVTHPDDQVKFILLTFHNHLNNKPLDTEKIAMDLLEQRKIMLAERKS